jgi:HEAT repeats
LLRAGVREHRRSRIDLLLRDELSGLAAYLIAELGIELEVPFDELLDIFEANPALARVPPETMRDILLRGTERDGDVGIACITAVVELSMHQGGPGNDPQDHEVVLAAIANTFEIEPYAAAWVDRLLAANAFVTLRLLLDWVFDAPDELRRAVSRAVLPLGVALDGPHASHAAGALGAIARRYRDDAGDLDVIVPRLCELLDDEEHRGAAIHALGLLQAPAAVPALYARLLATDDSYERQAITQALMKTDGPRAAPAIAVTADVDRCDVTVVDLLGPTAASGDAGARDFLERAMQSKAPAIRGRATRVRVQHGLITFDELCAVLLDPDASVRSDRPDQQDPE